MSTAFEFLDKGQRRIRFPRVVFLVSILIAVASAILHIFILDSTERLQKQRGDVAARVELAAQKAVKEASDQLPGEGELAEAERLTELFNLSMGPVRSSWTRFFNALERVLPDNVVLLAIENSKTGKPVFKPEDKDFRLRIAVPDIDAANYLYRKFSDEKSFSSMNFTPKGEIRYQGNTGISVEINLTFNSRI